LRLSDKARNVDRRRLADAPHRSAHAVCAVKRPYSRS